MQEKKKQRKKVDFDRRLLELAGSQHYVVAREQLLEFGTARQIEYRLAKGRLQRVHEGVYRVVGSPDTWQQRLMAACLSSSGANAASFRAGAQMFRLPAGDEIVEITAPRHRRMQLNGVRTHESFYLSDLDVTYIDGIPVTRPARILCDLGLLVERGELSASTYELAFQEAVRRNGEEPWWLVPPHHLNYLSFTSLEELLRRLDLEIIDTMTSFPMELFLLMGENYVDNEAVGKECHTRRKRFDLALEKAGMGDTRRKFYRALSNAGLGREAIVIARKPRYAR